jgi:16S rRNA (cytosine967-C5)-methyltransferase
MVRRWRWNPGPTPEGLVALDCPDWLAPRLQAALGPRFRAGDAGAAPARAGVPAGEHGQGDAGRRRRRRWPPKGFRRSRIPWRRPRWKSRKTHGKYRTRRPIKTGLVELQDAASQAVAEAVPLAPGQRVLDLCAGGGGKTLALAARASLRLWAHDANPRRMADLPARAARAGVAVTITEKPEKTAPYDVILTDVPCSGSGSWRRDPDRQMGADRRPADRSLHACRTPSWTAPRRWSPPAAASPMPPVRCLRDENEDRIAAFLARHPGWTVDRQMRLTPLQGGDGFGLAILRRT